MNFDSDKRTVMTLDAGGTNLVFAAIRGNDQTVEEIAVPSDADDLDKCLSNIVDGFSQIKSKLKDKPVAISFAFPGPADYPKGIIGALPNLPAFRGDVALGPMLQEKFGLPVFINNDGNLFAYGEANAGYLPYINGLLAEAGNPKRYKSLLGLTLGTGFGAGIVHDGMLIIGDNSNAAEIWLLRDKLSPRANIEEHASIRGVRRVYAREAGIRFEDAPEPKDIFEICIGNKIGDKQAGFRSFQEMGEAVGDAISSALTLIDGIAVIGGGLAGASEIFLPYVVKEMNSSFVGSEGKPFRRLVQNAYNLEDDAELEKFLKGVAKEIEVYGTSKKIKYDAEMRTGVGISKIGTSRAISIGAYAFALSSLDK
ncbi:MAG TPA: ROK family protein [Candidatus Acidoferrales bacterium]|nr:ROK family protein [Candidatus Acidoferrales bacterium]